MQNLNREDSEEKKIMPYLCCDYIGYSKESNVFYDSYLGGGGGG